MIKRFQASGLNSHFDSHQLPFKDYIAKMQDIIRNARVDLTPDNEKKIILANSPCEFIPNKISKYGVLLVHGLFDSPHMMQSLFNHYAAQNILVRSLLLPGHGTVPGDLLHVSYHSWISAIEYGINSLLESVDKVIIIGFSMGGLLSLSASYEYNDIAGVILIAPALKIQNRFVGFRDWYHFLSHYWPSFKWVNRAKDDDYAKYQSHTTNAVSQIMDMIDHLNRKINESHLTIPVFIAVSEQDEVISVEEIEEFFSRLSNPRNKLLIYSNHPRRTKGKIYFRPSQFPERNIIDFSHVCIPIDEDHPHYGQDGDYVDTRHHRKWWYKWFAADEKETWHYGAVSLENCRRYQLARLTYNPDFPNLANEFNKFIQECIN